jgi:mannose-6-phosphate isomerase
LKPDPLVNAARRLRSWLVEDAFPLWGAAGFDGANGRFEEQLDLAGQPIRNVPIRLMVQARQIYSFGLAARRGWYGEGETLIRQAFASMVRDFHRRDGRAGWIFSIGRDGAVADPRRDLYAHAFVLMGTGSYMLATRDRAALTIADETLAFLDAEMRAPQGGGYLDAQPPFDALRRQNPHMHMFEGLLTLWSASGERKYLERAGDMFELFRTRFFQPEPGVLCEYFDGALSPAAGVTGQIVEPGHHCEWVWLLRWFARESGKPVETYTDALYAHAVRHGFDSAGMVVDEVLMDGSHRTPSRRVWPVTETIKATIGEAALGREGASARIVALVDRLFDHFLTREPAGGWIDRLDANGAPATGVMPASTLYHLACAIDELDQAGQAR